MSKEYFTDNLSVEDIAQMTDKMLRFENSRKSVGNINARLFKIIPAVAAIVLVIGFMNILPYLPKTDIGNENAETDIATDKSDNITATDISFSTKADVDMSLDASDELSLGYNLSFDARKGGTYDELIKEIYDEPVLIEKYYKDISQINLDLLNENIVVLKGSSEIKIKYYEWTKDEYKITVNENGVLILKNNTTDKYLKDSSASNNISSSDWVNVILQLSNRSPNPENPSDSFPTIEVTLPENITLKSLNAGTINGNITINDCENNIKSILANTHNGDVNLSNCVSETFSHSGINGNITLDGCNIQSVSTGTHNGNVNLSNCIVNIISHNGINGDIIVSDCDINSLKINEKNYTDVQNGEFSSHDYRIPEVPEVSEDMIPEIPEPPEVPEYIFDGDYYYNGEWVAPWTLYRNGNKDVIILYSGAEVTTRSSYKTLNSNTGLMIPLEKSTIKLANGIVIKAPGKTIIKEGKDHILKITVGDGEATITQPDGTSSTVPAGTVLDSEGNIVK